MRRPRAAARPARWGVGVSLLLCLLCPAPARAQDSATTVPGEEAADFARRAAAAALHGPARIFAESIDADGILRRFLGGPVWGGLTRRQQDLLRATVRDHFADALLPPVAEAAEVRWAWVAPNAEAPIPVSLGLHYGAATLKTRWLLSHTPRGWLVEDVLLLDPGLSLAAEAGEILGPHAVIPRDRAREARTRILPRLLGLIAVVVAAVLFARRLPPERQSLLWLTAAVPAALFVVDGGLAARRALSEPYELAASLPREPWREFEKVALEQQRERNAEAARGAWEKAIAAGAPAASVYYQMGLSARGGGDTAQAQRDFAQALLDVPPAPGAGKELGLIALAEGRNEEARAYLLHYVEATGPDPDALANLAVADTNLGDSAAAVAAVDLARSMVGESWRRAELEAQIYARAGNAPAAVAALRTLEPQGRLDRYALRSDPSYLTIATDPAWVGFLDETQASPEATPSEPAR